MTRPDVPTLAFGESIPEVCGARLRISTYWSADLPEDGPFGRHPGRESVSPGRCRHFPATSGVTGNGGPIIEAVR